MAFAWLRGVHSDPCDTLAFQDGQTPVTVAVYDVLGRMMKDVYSGVAPSGELVLDLDASEFAAGTYFLYVESGSDRELEILRKP